MNGDKHNYVTTAKYALKPMPLTNDQVYLTKMSSLLSASKLLIDENILILNLQQLGHLMT